VGMETGLLGMKSLKAKTKDCPEINV